MAPDMLWLARTGARCNNSPMTSHLAASIRIAAALIDDEERRLLLVRKAGTRWFMQAGGKIEEDESPRSALRRELLEEIGLDVAEDALRYLGCFSAPAANEPNVIVEAELFHLRTSHEPAACSEIEEAIWISVGEAKALPLAPLTRDHVLPLVQTL
jgi:8-oxo-dGTP pyrophosphatase MutT (NUDIX family)